MNMADDELAYCAYDGGEPKPNNAQIIFLQVKPVALHILTCKQL